MSRNFFTPINLNGLELQGAAIGNLSTGSINAITSGTGRIQYDSTLNVLKYRDNSGWQTISTGGGSFTLGSTSIALGSTTATIAGLTSVTSTTFVGALTGNASTATTAGKWTSAVNLAGNSVDGSAAVAFANKFIVQGTTDAGLSGAQFLGALGTGILKNTTTTGVLSIAVAGDFPTLNQNTTGSAGSVANALTFGANLTASTGSSPWNGSAAATIALSATPTGITSINGISVSGSSGSFLTSATTSATSLATIGTLTGLTMGGAISLQSTTGADGYAITGLKNPTNAYDAATKSYVDTIATGINAHDAVSYASTANISGTYANGTSGVGATLTGTGSIVIDGYTVVTGDAGTNVAGGTGLRLLLKDQTLTDQNGIYALTACSSGTSWTLTRAYDYDVIGEVAAGDFTYVLLGNANAKFTFVQTSKPTAISGVGTGANAVTFGTFANGNLSGTVAVNQGGTGVTTLTGLAYGNGTSAFTAATAAQVVGVISTTAVTNATNAANVATTDSTSNTTYYPTVVASTTAGNQARLTNSNISWNASTAIISALGLTGASLAFTTTSNGNINLTPNGTGRIVLGGTTGSATATATGSSSATSSGVTIKSGDATVTSGSAGSVTSSGSITIDTGAATGGVTSNTNGTITIGGTNASSVSIDTGGTGSLNLGTTNSRAINIGSSTGTTAVTITGGSTAIALNAGSGGITLNQSTVAATITIGSATGTGTITLGSTTGAQTVNIATGATPNAVTKTVNIGTGSLSGSTTNIAIGSLSGTSTTTLQGPVALTTATAGGLLKTTVTTGVVGLATAGTDYLAPPSGTSLLKANSGGALANAVAGTDYIAPYGSTTANTFLAAPNGSAGTPSFRTVVYADLPTNVGVVARKVTLVGTGSGTTIALTHGLGTNLVTAQVYDTSTSTATLVEVDITVTSTTATATFAATTTLTNYTLVVIG